METATKSPAPNTFDGLVNQSLPWIARWTRQRLGNGARRDVDTMDIVQEVAIDVLQYRDQVDPGDPAGFRRLLRHIVENNIRDRRRYQLRACRQMPGQRQRATDSMLALDPSAKQVTSPPDRAARSEASDWLRGALAYLPPADREVVQLHSFDGLSFVEIAARLGAKPNAIRMRFERALPKLAKKVAALQAAGGAS